MSKENQNSARNTLFEIEARRQKSFVDATAEKVRNHQVNIIYIVQYIEKSMEKNTEENVKSIVMETMRL